MQNEKITSFVALVKKSIEEGSFVSLTFHSPSAGDCLKAKGKLKQIGGKTVLQLETSLTEGRVSQENVTFEKIGEKIEELFNLYKKSDLTDSSGSASVMISKKGSVTLLKKGKIGEILTELSVPDAGENNRIKNHVLTGKERFLVELGISDEKGRVHDKKQSKFRQICRFAEYISDAEKKLKKDGVLYVCDLCCGKSYLSFAAYHVLVELCGRKVKMSCVDLKKSVMEYCADIAEKCAMDGMEFIAMDISDFQPRAEIDLVISLHACDIATDIVLDFAARYRADAILSTPCCQHQLNNEMDCPTLSFIADYSLLRQKLATAATDALRLLKLEAEGYKADATELIDPEDTPKNIMLRGFRRKNYDEKSSEAESRRKKYLDAYIFMYGKAPEGFAEVNFTKQKTK